MIKKLTKGLSRDIETQAAQAMASLIICNGRCRFDSSLAIEKYAPKIDEF